MNELQKRQLIKAQQGELDAILLYQSLSRLTSKKKAKETMKQIAADEGKHAAILKQYTDVTLKPKRGKSWIVSLLYIILGKKFTASMLAKGELDSVEPYSKLAKDFPKIKEIIADEKRHALLSQELL